MIVSDPAPLTAYRLLYLLDLHGCTLVFSDFWYTCCTCNCIPHVTMCTCRDLLPKRLTKAEKIAEDSQRKLSELFTNSPGQKLLPQLHVHCLLVLHY